MSEREGQTHRQTDRTERVGGEEGEREREWETPERWTWSGGGGIGVSDGGVEE